MENDHVLDLQERKDFFISYTGADKQWAEWIAFQLEAAGYTLFIQAWDFRPGSNFVVEMDKASQRAERTLIVLSPAYLKSDNAFPEWAAALRKDPKGKDGRVLPVRIQKCEVNGLLGPIVYIDLVGLDKQRAQEQLLVGVQRGRVKPTNVPFPDDPAPLPNLQGNVPSSYSQSKEIPNESTNTSKTENGALSNLHPLLNTATKDGKYQPGEGIPKPNTRRNMRKRRLLVSAAILLSLVFSLIPVLSPSACFFAFCNTSKQPTKQSSSQDGEVAYDQNLYVELGAVVSPSFVIPDDPKRYSGSNLPPMTISAVLLTKNPSPYDTIIINVKDLRYGGADILINYIALKLLSVPALPQSLKVWTPGASTTYIGYPYPVKYTGQTPGQLLYARPPYNDKLTPARPGHSGESDPLSIQVTSTVTAYLCFQIQISYQVTDTGIPYKLTLPRVFKVVFSDASNWHEEIL